MSTCLVSYYYRPTVLLFTLLVMVTSADGIQHTLHALIDIGSEMSFITSKCSDHLTLPQRQHLSKVRPFACAPVILSVESSLSH